MAGRGHPIPEEVLPLLSKVPLFMELNRQQLDYLLADAQLLEAPAQQMVCEKGASLHGFYCVLAGKVKLFLQSAGGQEKIIDVVGPGSSFAEAAVFLDRPCPVYAQTLEPTRMIYVQARTVLKALDEAPQFARSMLAGLSIRLHQLINEVESSSLQNASQRVVGYLLEEAGQPEQGAVKFTLPISKATIAAKLGLTPETFSRALGCLSKQGLISVEGRCILLRDVQRMKCL
jgi:CRP-like cAMP-binding protein